ncbi:unnamed protein product, partial [Mesorhabditis belari]|uniref:PHD finger protein 14 n=1 Tax=Mesorhabditis belari TaxID=2138241 RepID=A0AAF3FDP2_9BILA
MAEDERASFFKYAATRAPGKRQIKPTALLELVVTGGDDDEDEDFKIDKKTSETGSDESSDESSSDSGSDDNDSDSNLDDSKSEDFDQSELDDLRKDIVNTESASEKLVCSVCLNLRDLVKNEEVIQCDKCGLCVHEACYGTDLGDDSASTHSTSSTEPWFCEPCLFGLIEPPYCELCPNRFGAFKRTDIGGQWVHLVCALYTPGCTFGDAEKLTAISTMEIDYSKNYGRKACSGCSSRLEARVGIATECDAAMCKQFFHPTCAQRLGLLISSEEVIAGPSEETVYIHCKKHSQEEIIRKKRLAYARFHRYEEKRMIGLKRKKLTEREERFRKRNLERLTKTHKQLEGVTICWPGAQFDENEIKQRRIRPLQTSMRIVEGLAEKTEDNYGISREDFEKEFFKVRGETLPFLPPAFSPEFVSYFHNRERNVLSNEQKRLEALNEQNKTLREQMNQLEENALKSDDDEKKLDASLKKFQQFYDALVKLGVKKLTNPFVSLIKERKSGGKKQKKTSTSAKGSNPASPIHSPQPFKKANLHECKECKKQIDQHLLIECDQCHAFYHIRCLDPPLEKMPKKTNFDWHCSDCISDDEDEEEREESEQSDEDAPRKLKLRQRSDANKAQKLQEALDQRRAYRSAMQNARQKPKTNGDSPKKTKKKAAKSSNFPAKRPRSQSNASSTPISPSSRSTSKASKRSPDKKNTQRKSPRLSSPSSKKKKLGIHENVLKGRQVYVADNGLPSYYDSDVSEEFCLLD